MELEVGKTYVSKSLTTRTKSDWVHLVRIAGEVQNDTEEYKRGCRFFSDSGIMYAENGKVGGSEHRSPLTGKLTWSAQQEHDRSNTGLEREATRKDLSGSFVETFILYRHQLTKANGYILLSELAHPLKIGNVYVDRMGLLHLLNKVNHSEEADDVRFRSASRGSFRQNGRIYKDDRLSMRDLIYMKV